MPPDRHGAETRPAEGRREDGLFAGPLSRVPLQSRLALTTGVVVGLFASIVLTGAGDGWSMAALWIGVGGGFVAGAVLWMRARHRTS